MVQSAIAVSCFSMAKRIAENRPLCKVRPGATLDGRMKLAVSTYSLWRWRTERGKTLEQSVDWIAQNAGVPGIEFAGPAEPSVPDPIKRAARWRRRAEKGGLDVVS